MKQTSSSLDELLNPSCREASEHTAAAALTELRNNNNHHHKLKNRSTASPNAIVTSILSKNHIDHLEANSVSVIPIDAANNGKHNNGIGGGSIIGGGIPNAQQPNRISVKKSLGQINAAVTLNQMNHMQASMPHEAATALEMHRLTQLQQHLETAAVLMDISKKVIISPPSSNPQSPGLGDNQQNVKMTIKRMSSNNTGDEYDMSNAKRVKGNNVTTTVYQLDNDVRPSMSAASVKSEPAYSADDNSDNESNDSDPGRLQMDISSTHDNDDGVDGHESVRCSSSPVKLVYKHNRSYNNNKSSGRDTPESNKSDDHRTDPATTQLWQALARSTGED